jgi:putative membrane protein
MFSTPSNRRALPLSATAALAALTLAACGPGRDNVAADTMAMDTSPATAMSPMASSLSDPQILQVFMAINTADSTSGALAVRNAHDARVRSFARTMVKDHGELNRKAGQLQLGDTTQSARQQPGNPTAMQPPSGSSDLLQQLRSSAESEMSELQNASGAAFDSLYINSEVDAHQHVLDQLDSTLIPAAQDEQLKDLLQSARTTIAGHLDQAKQLQGTIATTAAGSH